MKLLLALGSNMGDRDKYLSLARAELGEFLTITQVSTIIETEPWGYCSPHKYLNQVLRCECTLSPEDLLKKTQEVEKKLGRITKTQASRYADRTIDIDILRYGDLEISTPDLTIPHPKMKEREFILKSLLELGEI